MPVADGHLVHDLPADQLDAIVLAEDTEFDHLLVLVHRESVMTSQWSAGRSRQCWTAHAAIIPRRSQLSQRSEFARAVVKNLLRGGRPRPPPRVRVVASCYPAAAHRRDYSAMSPTIATPTIAITNERAGNDPFAHAFFTGALGFEDVEPGNLVKQILIGPLGQALADTT